MKIRTERMKKGTALMMGFVMVAMVFAAMQPASATIINTQVNNSRNVQISATDLDSSPLYPGEHVTFYVTVLNGDSPDGEALYHTNVTVSTTIRDANGNTVTSPFSHWIVTEKNDDVTIQDQWTNPYTHQFSGFQAIVSPNAVPGTYNLTVTVSYTDNVGVQHFTYTAYILFDVTHNIVVSDAYPNLYAGQTFTDLYIDVSANWNGAYDLYLNLSNIPNGITFDSMSGWIPGTVGNPSTVGFKVDVARDMAPGVYTIDYQVQYYNPQGEWCTETGTLDITVDFTPVIEAQLTGNNITVTQGDASIPALGVRFTNTGNVPLRDIDINLDYDGYFFYTDTSYYEGAAGSDEQNPVQVTEVHIDSLDVGATAQGQWYVALNPYVQAGEHRILFDWTATYFDDGSTGNPTNYVKVQVSWWDDDGDSSTPMVPEIRFDRGTGWSGWTSPWIAGPYVMITVIDNNPDFTAETIYNEDANRYYFDLGNQNLVNVEISCDIDNLEQVGFLDIRAALQVGPGTPFFNPVDHSATTVENDIGPSSTSISPGGTAEMYWHVDVNPNTPPGVYKVNITITGRNADTTEYITATTQATAEIRGVGPELVVTGVTTGDICPGKIFYLNLTITNRGDDTARDVFVSIPGHIGYNWDVIDGFVSAISSSDDNKMVSVPNGYYDNYSYYWPGWGYYGEEYIQDGSFNHTQSKDTEYSGVTLQQLNISDAKDIVDLALYIEGVFNSPTPEIWLMKADNVAPGQSITLSFKMKTNINMVEGRPYEIKVVTSYTDSYGNGPNPKLQTQEITIRTTNPGTPYHSAPTQSAGKLTDQQMIILGIILLVILLIIVGIALAGRGGGGKKKKEKPAYEAPAEEAPEEVQPEEPAPEEMPPEEPGFTLEEKEEGESSF